MGLTIKLYRCSDENERMDKSLTLLKSCSGQVKNDVSITNPVFVLETTPINGLNYLFCEEYGRYYYITDITIMTGNRISCVCKCDVLMSFRNQIRNCKAIINKQEGEDKSSKYIDDGSYVIQCNEVIQTYEFPNALNGEQTILITAGGR